FEYLAADLPVLAANYPEARRFVDGHGVGSVFDPDNPRSIANAIRSLKNDPARRDEMSIRAPDVLAEIDAEREWNKMIDIYASLGLAGRANLTRPACDRGDERVLPAQPK